MEKASSIRATSASLSRKAAAAAFSRACSGLDVLGIAKTDSRLVIECKPDLTGRRAARGGDLLEHAAAIGVRAGEVAVAERAVSRHGDAVCLAPGEDGVFDRALAQIILYEPSLPA
ncbi:MAG TPA: hypothetical protein VMS17_31735 [Gemmataceae bacterium]|nr:hypothetical protein [Gemmataceae bacterium]